MTTASATQRRALSATAVIWFVAAAQMLQPLSTDLYLPTLPGLATHFATSTATVQWTLSIFVAAFGAWQLIAGPLSDRYGRYPVVAGGALVYCAGSAVSGFAASIDWLIAGRLLQAVGACSCLVGTRAMVRDLYEPAVGARVLAAASTLMAAAPIFGPVAGALFYEAFGWRSSFALLGGVGAVLAVIALLRLQETNHQRNARALHMAPMWAATRMIFSTPSFRAYTAALTLSYAGLFAYLSGSPFVFMRVFHWSATEYGLWLPVMATGFFVGSYSCRLLLPRYAIAGTVCRGALLQLASGGSMAALAIAGVHHPAAIIVPMFFFGISHGWIQPPSMAGAVAPFPERAGLASALFGALMMAAAAAIGYLIGASFNGTVYPLTLTIGATSVASALTAWTLVRRHGHV